MKKKKNTALGVCIVFIVALLIGVIFGYFTISKLKEENEKLNTSISSNTQTVYVATTLIEKGAEIISEGEGANVELQTIYTGLEAFNYITEEEIGNVAVVDILEGVPVMYAMVTDKKITSDSREYEVSTANLATDQREYDVVDVRITFPDGSDYVVLSKKEITNLDLENCLFTTILNEEEILRYTCAMVDAFTTTGARIYTTRYVESNVQDPIIVNYPVRDVTRELINSDPNVVTKAAETLNASARVNLETRLGTIPPEGLDAVSEGFGLVDTAQSAVIQQQAVNKTEETTQNQETQSEEKEDNKDEESSEKSSEE